MGERVKMSVADGIAILVVENPPLNNLTPPLRLQFQTALKAAQDNPDVSEIAILGHGGRFPWASDVPGKDGGPSLADLCDAIEASPKPVVAGVLGGLYGSGVDLALAAHYRIAHARARFGLSLGRTGMVPMAGATQRAPRLLGVPGAISALLAEGSRPVSHPDIAPIFDQISDEPLAQTLLAFCKSLREAGKGPRPTQDMPVLRDDFEAAREAIEAGKEKASAADDVILSCLDAAMLLPFEAGLAFEQEAAADFHDTEASVSLRHLAEAEERLPRRAKPGLSRIAVFGGGALAVRAVLAALSQRFEVFWGIDDDEVRKESILALHRMMGGNPDDPRFTRLRTGLCPECPADVPGILLARPVGTASLPENVPVIKLYADRIERIGLRIAQGFEAGRLAEIVEGPEATAEERDLAIAITQKLLLLPVIVGSSGFTIADRLAAASFRATDALVDLGQDFGHIDRSLAEWGWSVPPFLLRDRTGTDTVARMPRAKGGANWALVAQILDRPGKGRPGFYDYPEGQPPVPSPRMQAGILEKREGADPMPAQDIAELVLAAVANEGARMLSDRWAQCPSDIDLVAVNGLGFPRSKGGPMHAADRAGLLHLSNVMKQFDHPDTPFWTAHSVWADLIKNGKTFDSLNASGVTYSVNTL